MIRIRYVTAAFGVVMLAACSSAPVHYYTLVPPPQTSEIGAAAVPAANFQFELLPVTIPAQNDQPQLIVRQGAQGIAVLNSERWIAPLADEMRSALSVDLSRQLNAQDVNGGIAIDGKQVLRIKVDVQRFDSAPGDYALLEATWTVRPLKGTAVLTCASHINEPVAGADYGTLVAAHQRALGELAAQIASVAPGLATASRTTCPVR